MRFIERCRAIFARAASGRSHARALWIFCIAALVFAGTAAGIAGTFERSRAIAALETQARTDAALSAALLRAVLERQRALPLILSDDRDVREALVGRNADALMALNGKLEDLARETRAAVIYVIGREGIALSASNWREPTSFVGNDYRFRAYFQNGIGNGAAEHFALGNVSKKPGLYIARRIDGPDGPLGVVVAKVEFDEVEADWRASGKILTVVDERRIVLVTSLPSWRFMSIGPVPSDQLETIRNSLQFGDAPLKPLPLRVETSLDADADLVDAVIPGGAGETAFLEVRTPLPTTSWSLRQMVPLSSTIPAAVRASQMLALLIALPFAALGGLALRRRQRIAQRRTEEEAARTELELRVAERTRDLSLARDHLTAEVADHQATEGVLREVQQSLVQANRLAILGQVAAGVAHEINQPVATIRAYADNARTFLDHGRMGEADGNLTQIAHLTERIGSITDELKAFSRKGRGVTGPTSLRQVVDGALMLLRSRFSGHMEALEIAMPSDDLLVVGNRIRLEQVLINLVQNALEAAAEKGAGAVVRISVVEEGGDVALSVSDNGPGLADDIREALFTPFNTSKESGLGLGLVISKDIVSDYGGRIDVSSDASGTRFTVHLKKAEPA